MNFYNFVNTVFMPTTFTSLANVLCLTKNPMSFWMDSNHRPQSLKPCALPTEPQNDVAANHVTGFFYRGHTSRLKFRI